MQFSQSLSIRTKLITVENKVSQVSGGGLRFRGCPPPPLINALGQGVVFPVCKVGGRRVFETPLLTASEGMGAFHRERT